MSFPRIIFVKKEKGTDGTVWFISGRNLEEISPDVFNTPETIGVYVLKHTRRLIKKVAVV